MTINTKECNVRVSVEFISDCMNRLLYCIERGAESGLVLLYQSVYMEDGKIVLSYIVQYNSSGAASAVSENLHNLVCEHHKDWVTGTLKN